MSSPTGNIQYGASNFYSASDGDWSEAARVIRRLGRGTLCLKWLDLEGCTDWIRALVWTDREGLGGVDWIGAWRGLETVRCGQGWVPRLLAGDEKTRLAEMVPGAWLTTWDAEEERKKFKEHIAETGWIDREKEARSVESMVASLRRGKARPVSFEFTNVQIWVERTVISDPGRVGSNH